MAWTAEDNFDSYADGDLTGENGGSNWGAAWSGDTDFDVQGTVVYQGAKAVIEAAGAAGSINRQLGSNITAGTVYVAMRASGTGGALGDMVTFLQDSGGTNRMAISFDGGNIRINNNGTYETIGTYVANTWYVIGFDFDNVAQPNLYRCNIDGGTYSVYKTVVGGSYTNIGFFKLEGDGGGSVNRYWDYISPTSPFASNKHFLSLLGVGS